MIPIPRFSLLRLLVFTTICAVLSLVLTLAAESYIWLVALGTAAIAGVVVLLVSAFLFMITELVVLKQRRAASQESTSGDLSSRSNT